MSLFLRSTDTGLQVVTGSAGRVDSICYYADVVTATSAVDVDHQETASGGITTGTTTTVISPPASGSKRNVHLWRVTNTHATVSNPVTLQHHNGTYATVLMSVTLAPGEAIAYNEGIGMRVLGANGVEKASTGGTLTAAFASVGLTASAADTYVGGFPVSNRIQAGSMITWQMVVSKTGAGVAAPIFTFRAGTAGAVGDTSRVALTSPFTQTGVIDSGVIEAWATIRTHGASGILVAGYNLSHALAATGLATQPAYGQSGVSAAFDTTAAGLVIGLSVNPGASGVWTIDSAGMAAYLVA